MPTTAVLETFEAESDWAWVITRWANSAYDRLNGRLAIAHLSGVRSAYRSKQPISVEGRFMSNVHQESFRILQVRNFVLYKAPEAACVP